MPKTPKKSAALGELQNQEWKAVRLSICGSSLPAELKRNRLKPGCRIVDRYEEQLREIFLLQNPRFRFSGGFEPLWKVFLKKHLRGKPMVQAGEWFYYPWLHAAVHVLKEPMFLELRTGRNRNLITADEQKKYYQAAVGCMGMSVGSHAVLTVVMTGGAKHVKLADADTISGSNLNRIRTGIPNIGTHKTIAVARQIVEMNPYADVEIFQEGVNDLNIEKFFRHRNINLLIEETDNPYIKIKARHLARQYKVPVIMAADNGDNTIVDVERYDLRRNLPILHGIITASPDEFKAIPPQDLPKVIANIAGANLSTERMLRSVMEVGKTLYSWPQLGTAATLCGSVLAYLARRIITGQPVREGRFDVNIDALFNPPTKADTKRRDALLKKLLG